MSLTSGTQRATRPKGIMVAGALMVIFGIAEVATGFTGRFLGGISVATSTDYTVTAVATGACYSAAGLSVLTMKRLGAGLGIMFLCAELLGRIYLVSAGLYPLSGIDKSSFIAGSIIALIFILFIISRWKSFR